MILDSIILNNFGVYAGHQEAILTPENGKPIILFGGMNGGGKTTLLDAIQLAFYGPKAKISNRGRLGYKEYLRQSINRGSDSEEGAGITITFRRIIDDKMRSIKLHRHWRENRKSIDEHVTVLCDNQPDYIYSEHWDETIESYLPADIAHLFFFDGEQIKELAEGGHAAAILGTAVNSLLGLDIVDRLENDLKVFERRKRSEGLTQDDMLKLNQMKGEIEQIDREHEKAAMDEGSLVNETGRLNKELKAIEDLFSDEGGEIFLKRNELEENLKEFKKQRANKEAELRELAAGPLPLLMLMDLLEEVEQFAIHESDVKKASLLLDILEARDDTVIRAIKSAELPAEAGEILSHLLEKDRSNRSKLANEPLIFNAEEGMASRIAHLRTNILPVVDKQSKVLIEEIASFDENILRLETELERVPTEERIVDIQSNLNRIRDAHRNKMSELESIRVRIVTLQRQRTMAESKLNKIGNSDIDARYAEDDRLRMLSHSPKIRETLGQFRTTVIQKHLSNIEGLMLESFKKLLRKSDLVKGLSINPANYEVTLLGRDHKILPFDRLSAGERQLLATSLLWGLARASGHPVPTVIDTPLGRLDSSHRKHLIERYFPNASHQVLLLSTDEEIVGPYYKALRPYISRTYLLSHDEAADKTSIEKGYFQA